MPRVRRNVDRTQSKSSLNRCRQTSHVKTHTMTPYEDFEHSIASTISLTDMYSELRSNRGLGRRGRLPPGNEDLLWLPRSAVVTALSSLDAYVHAVLRDRVTHALRFTTIPNALCKAMADLIPIKDAHTFRTSFEIVSHRNIIDELSKRLHNDILAYQSYQMPDKIVFAYALIGYSDIFVRVSKLWSGPRTSDNHIKRQLAKYVSRRNQIVHEGDRDGHGATRRMQPLYATTCAKFIDNLVLRLDRVIYELNDTPGANQ